ncbi:MAG: cytochrome c [Sandaracinaceae bacterium]|mgnify:FL=1|jgi:mono/diheme cytochrome c family protein|nr:cytochrome c [Sandaracinaceae bacterium]MBK6811444.1 cytochrome c [Sandaracinaceae bacterium]MBK8410095.1 cytochrome c [Sandaracinaceae bacterium]MBK8592986.1 cytochrome c [Sandaracinaceae bacterium]MBP7684628.1 cytochrome c [Deltaproteobacteria bacterium]
MKKFGIAMAAAALMLGGCGGGGEEAEGEGSSGGESVASYEGAVTSTDVTGGQQVYADFCSGCHQDGTGGDGAAPAVHSIGWTAARMRQQVREGEDSMPAFGASVLSDEQLESLMAYLVSTNGVAN